MIREAEVVSSSVPLTDGHNSNSESHARPPKKAKGLGAILKSHYIMMKSEHLSN